MNDSKKSKEEWKLQKRGGKKPHTKREQKRLRMLEKAKSGKLVAAVKNREKEVRAGAAVAAEAISGGITNVTNALYAAIR